MVVEADVIGFPISVHFTVVSFNPMFNESIDNVEIKGEASSAEVLTKVNVADSTTLCDIYTLVSLELICALTTSTSVLGCKMLHLMNSTDAVHVS